MSDFVMPSLGADMEDGTLVEWLVKPGQTVKTGDIVAVVETQKGAIEIEIFEDGVISDLLIGEGTKVPVGTAIARLNGGGAAPDAAPEPAAEPAPPAVERPAAEAPAPSTAPARPPASRPPPRPAPRPATGARARVSPAARVLSGSLGVALDGLTGTGPDGAVTSRDVRAAALDQARPTPTPARGLDLDAMQQAVAAAMARSKREIPHYYLSRVIDLSAATDWLEAENAARPPADRLLIATLLQKATALALRKVPEMNGFFQDGAFTPSEAIHMGTAVSIRGGGLIAPAIHHCDRLGLDELMARLRDLVERVRGGGLRSSEMTDPTVTLSSLGDRGVEALYGVIYPPQVALIGFGRVEPRVLAVDGVPLVRPAVTVTLSADHRVSDGKRGSQFLNRIDSLLRKPEKL